MKRLTLSSTWLAVLVSLFAALALAVSLAVTHAAVRADQHQRAALLALRDYSALLSKMDQASDVVPTDPAYFEAWLAVFQTRPGLSASLEDGCLGEQPNVGLRFVSVPGGATSGTPELDNNRAIALDNIGPNVFLTRFEAGQLCPNRAVEVVSVRETVSSMNVTIARMVEPTSRAWSLVVAAVIGMSLLLIAFGFAAAAWARSRLVTDVNRLNANLEQAARGEFAPAISPLQVNADLRDLTQQVNSTLARVQELLTWLRDTSDQMAHDFRTPLARAQARLERFVKSNDPDLIAKAQADLAYLNQTMNEALSLRDGESWVFDPVRLDQVAAASAELYQPVAEQHDIEIETDLSFAETMGVASLLQRAIANLVDNAVKYSPQGGKVWIRSGQQGKVAWIEVADQGPGMQATQAENASTAPVLDSHRMGLAFVRAIVRRHAGALDIQSNSSGTRVTLRI